ncbi:hypothetical protein GCM10027286_24500 [Virgibacillus ainsalahensis]
MKYIVAIFWGLAISLALSYVLTSMGGEQFVLADALLLGAIISIAVFVLAEGPLRAKNEQ